MSRTGSGRIVSLLEFPPAVIPAALPTPSCDRFPSGFPLGGHHSGGFVQVIVAIAVHMCFGARSIRSLVCPPLLGFVSRFPLRFPSARVDGAALRSRFPPGFPVGFLDQRDA
jgi:hypothetical protein